MMPVARSLTPITPNKMRAALDRIYGAALVLSCLCLAAIAVMVLVQVAGRLIDRLAVALGAAPLQIMVPSLAELSGFLLVAGVFLAMPAALQSGTHVRVTMIAGNLPPMAGRVLTMAVLIMAALLTLWAAWYAGDQALDSWQFNSRSFGMVKTPLWIPQAAMTAGLVLLALALIDALVVMARGGVPAFLAAETAAAADPAAAGHEE